MPTTVKNRKSGPVYKGVVQVQGNRKEAYFPATPKGWKEAKKWERETKERLRLQLEQDEIATGSILVIDWLNQYLDWVVEIQSKRTVEEKQITARYFIKSAGKNTKVEDLTLPKVMTFLRGQFRRRSGYAANKAKKNLSAAWEWGRRHLEGFPDKPNPFKLADTFPEKRRPRYVPPEDDFWRVYHEAEDQQDKTMLMFALHTAARKGEIYRAKVDDLDFTRETIMIRTSKREHGNTEYDRIPMTKTLKKELQSWLKERPVKSEHLFVNLGQHHWAAPFYGEPFVARQHFLEKLCKKAGVKPFTWHGIRHLTASTLYHAGVERAVIQQILRHKSAGTTDRYLKRLGLDECRDSLSSVLDNGAHAAAAM
jgi:integrase